MFGEGFWPTIGLLLLVLWLGSAVAGNTIHKVWAARLGSLAFVGQSIYLASSMRPYGAEWFGIVIMAGIVGGFVYGGSQIALPILFAAHQSTLGAMASNWRSWRRERQKAANERRRKKESEKYQRRAQEEYERAAPERERQRQAEERRRELAARDAKRRQDARAACELAYGRCAIEIKDRFSRQDLDRYMTTYMGDQQTADDVERRGEELRKMMEDYRQPPKREKKTRTIGDLAEWYVREKEQIQSLPLDEERQQELLVALEARYEELTEEVLQRMEP